MKIRSQVKENPNALALPGGVICITDSLMELLQNEAELVEILGHEGDEILNSSRLQHYTIFEK